MITPDLVFDRKRSRFFFGLAFLGFFILLIRAVTILVIPPSAEILANLAKRQYQTKIKLSPYRGPIFDRQGEPLAISIRKPSIFINPKVFSPTKSELKKLASILKLNDRDLVEIRNRKGYFAWVKRKISFQASEQIEKLDLRGLHQVMEPARYYPAGSAASQLIGYVGIDNNGLMGLELEFDDILSGEEIHAIRSRDARGRTIFTTASAAAPEETGQRLYLTIDRVIQEMVEKALANGIERAKAKSGFVIVSDPHTGRLLAIANYPKFDPNQREVHNLDTTKNRALVDVYEPGSVVKPLVIGRALAEGKTTLQSHHDTENGIYRENSWTIRDSHPLKEEEETTEGLLVHSSNIGIYKIAKMIGAEALFQTFRDYGIGSRENLVGFPHQRIGSIQDWEKWRSIRFANISFGQGFLASGIEMVQAYGAIANGGHLMKPILIDHIENSKGVTYSPTATQILRRVLDPSVAKKLRRVLQKVVEEGSGRNAILDLYTSAGKTGTTEKVDPLTKSYSNDLRIASFIGFAPVEDPHLVIYVVVDEPGVKPYYGGTWAAPVFKEIAEKTLHYLNVAPDRVKTSSSLPLITKDLTGPIIENLSNRPLNAKDTSIIVR